eukprot:TRINITY_DN26744_c2_g1_i2.p1 TRINITY_DN26744_c2_g1~~TRINITY_DN26744_c2_g1_i2.p1  ORF type:complete len:281 (-),score=38.08 TRINITY_DN26744_c2_g1_i2:75-917(-)
MLHLLQSIITQALTDGVITCAPPIASRVYQTISRGFVKLLNAKKIQDTKFPFPLAQLIILLLVIQTFLTPLMISAIIRGKVLAFIFTLVPLWGIFCLDMVSIELENPFGTDDNDLPLRHFQDEMNNCLIMLLHPNTDLIAGLRSDCETDFTAMYNSFAAHMEQDSESGVPYTLGKATSRTFRLSDYPMNREGDESPKFAGDFSQNSSDGSLGVDEVEDEPEAANAAPAWTPQLLQASRPSEDMQKLSPMVCDGIDRMVGNLRAWAENIDPIFRNLERKRC